MSNLNTPSINDDSKMPKSTKQKIAVGVLLSLFVIGLGIAAMRKVPEVETQPVVETTPEDVVLDIDNLNMSKSSWRDAAWCAVDKETVTSINIVDNYEGPSKVVWLVDELIFSQTEDGDVYIAVGPGLHMLGSMKGAFAGFTNATSITGLHLLETSKVTDMSYIFSESKFEQIDISMWDTKNVTNFAYMLYQTQYTDIVNMNNIDLSNVLDVSYMFAYCTSVTNIYLENVDTSHIVNMEGMFDGVGSSSYKGKTVLHGTLDTSSCTNMSYMFRRSKLHELSSIVENFNTEKVTNMKGMFYHGLNVFELDLSKWDVSNVVDMTEMFTDVICLTTLNMEGWTPTKLRYADRMFRNCHNLRAFTQWNATPNVKSAEAMFENCFEMRDINMTCFDGITIENADRMFYCLQFVEQIPCNGFTIINPAPEMFLWCIGLNSPTLYDDTKVSEQMATTTGYFTATKG